MKKCFLIAVCFCFAVIFISKNVFADIAPLPKDAAENFRLDSESVELDVQNDYVKVVANFEIIADKKPQMNQYCPNYLTPKGGRSPCEKPYYQFGFIYPILKGQKFSSFRVFIGNEEIRPSSTDKLWVPNNIKNVERWITWETRRLEESEVKIPYKMKVKVEYVEPLVFEGSRSTFTYVLRTGALWKDKIGEAKIFVKSVFPNITFSIPPTAREANKVSWIIKDFEPDQDLVVEIKR